MTSLTFFSAGVTDSALTNHGVIQANRLGQHLLDRNVKVSHLFSSDLQRAFKTAEAIRLAQIKAANQQPPIAEETKQLAVLREQDFGFYEGKAFSDKSRGSGNAGKAAPLESGFVDMESKDAMKARSDIFVNEHIIPLLGDAESSHTVVTVAHGIILGFLWRSILHRFPTKSVSVATGAATMDGGFTLENLGFWSNTAYLELEIIPNARFLSSAADSQLQAALKLDLLLAVKAINCTEHLKGLKKTRGGIGSLKHDEGQKSIESFFKKRKIG